MSHEGKRPDSRRIVYIHKTFQRNFIMKFCLIALASMLLASLLLYFFSKDTMTATYRYHHLAIQRTGEVLLPALIITNLIVLLGLIAATVLVTLYVSHKIGGPLYRLNKRLESIAQGDLTMQIRLRHHDQLTDFASAINTMTEALKGKVLEIQREVVRLKEKTQAEGPGKEEIGQDMERLYQTVHKLFQTGE